jgi:hypothetical protein
VQGRVSFVGLLMHPTLTLEIRKKRFLLRSTVPAFGQGEKEAVYKNGIFKSP